MDPAVIRFCKYFARQAKGIIGAFEQMLTEIEREQGPRPGPAPNLPLAKLTPEQVAAIEKIVTVHHDNGRQ